MEIKVKIGGKDLIINNVKKLPPFGKFIGLMFQNREKSQALLFEDSKNTSIHSFFVFFNFLILWLNDKNEVLDYKVVKPFSIYEKSPTGFTKIIEIPINRRYHKIVTFIVGERFKKKKIL
jgi:uncharacterized membrane protein (UPF0127 family)